MKYRKFGKLDWEVSALGFGAMRLPVHGERPMPFDPNIIEDEAIRMIRYSVDNGVNYIDSAYPYHSGKSEVIVGKALQDGYRENVRVATKMPSWFVNTYDDFDMFFNQQRERLGIDRIDCYLLHSLNKHLWPKLRDLKVIDWAQKKKATGEIDYLGFSFHDDIETFKTIINEYDGWDFCQIQYNYMDIDFQAGAEGLHYAADKGLGVVIMEPLRGGQLTKKPPAAVQDIWEKAPAGRSQADWALQWLWNQKEVSVVLSGMTAMEQVVENVESARHSGVGSLSEDELVTVKKVYKAYKTLSPVPCTGCGYCMPCPGGVDIPNAFTHYNNSIMYNDRFVSRFMYRQKGNEMADKCVECLECEEKCPQGVPITEWLKKAHDLLGPRKKAY